MCWRSTPQLHLGGVSRAVPAAGSRRGRGEGCGRRLGGWVADGGAGPVGSVPR